MKRIAIVFNGKKDRRKCDSFIQLLKEKTVKKNIEIKTFVTNSAEDVSTKTKESLQYNAEIIVAAGGDGTLRCIIDELCRQDANVTVVTLPLGCSNDYAHMLGIRTIEDTVQALISNSTLYADIGKATYYDKNGGMLTSYFCSSAGVGFIASIDSCEKNIFVDILKKVTGNFTWPILTIINSFFYKSVDSEIIINDKAYKECLSLFELFKVSSSGGVKFVKNGNLNNGFFDAWMIRDAKSFDIINIFYRAVLGKYGHLENSLVDYFSIDEDTNRYGIKMPKKIEINPNANLPFNLNGDYVGSAPVKIEMAEKKINFLFNGDAT